MSIPASGPISMSMLNTELGRSFNSTNTQLAGASTPTSPALFYLANQSSSVGINQTAPHSISEFYSYTANLNTPVYLVVDRVGDGGSGCQNGSNYYNVQFTGTIPGGTFEPTDQLASYYAIVSGLFLNSGSDFTVDNWNSITNCNI
jgi:hypothetical protein